MMNMGDELGNEYRESVDKLIDNWRDFVQTLIWSLGVASAILLGIWVVSGENVLHNFYKMKAENEAYREARELLELSDQSESYVNWAGTSMISGCASCND